MWKEWFYLRNLCVDDVPVFVSLAQRDHVSQKLSSLLDLTQNYKKKKEKPVIDDAVAGKSLQQDYCYLYLLEICPTPPRLGCDLCLKPRVCLPLDLLT